MAKAYVNYDDNDGNFLIIEHFGELTDQGGFKYHGAFDINTIYAGYHFPTKKAAILDLIQKRLDDISRLSSEIYEIKEKYKDDLND